MHCIKLLAHIAGFLGAHGFANIFRRRVIPAFGAADFGERILEVEERISKDYQSQRISRSGKVFHLPGPVVI